jgi:hypothetical protein
MIDVSTGQARERGHEALRSTLSTLRSTLSTLRSTLSSDPALEWIDYLTPLDLVEQDEEERDPVEEIEVDLDLRYRAQRAIVAVEGLTTSERPACKHATEDVARYAGLDALAGSHRAYQQPAETSPERTIRRLREILPRADAKVRTVSISETEVQALLDWREGVDLDDDLDDAPFQTVDENADPEVEVLLDAHRDALDRRRST